MKNEEYPPHIAEARSLPIIRDDDTSDDFMPTTSKTSSSSNNAAATRRSTRLGAQQQSQPQQQQQQYKSIQSNKGKAALIESSSPATANFVQYQQAKYEQQLYQPILPDDHHLSYQSDACQYQNHQTQEQVEPEPLKSRFATCK